MWCNREASIAHSAPTERRDGVHWRKECKVLSWGLDMRDAWQHKCEQERSVKKRRGAMRSREGGASFDAAALNSVCEGPREADCVVHCIPLYASVRAGTVTCAPRRLLSKGVENEAPPTPPSRCRRRTVINGVRIAAPPPTAPQGPRLHLRPCTLLQPVHIRHGHIRDIAWMPRFGSQPAPTTVRLGDSQVMACEVNADLVPFTRWEKDRQPLEPSSRLVQLPSGALAIGNASEADAGLYRCLVENVGSSKSSDEAQLRTLPETGEDRRPEFLVQPAPVTKVLGAGVLLPCVVSGHPAPHVSWMLGDKTLQESDGRLEVLAGGSLQISNLTEEDAGVYTCVADNSNATIEAQAQLTVQVPPQFVKRPANVYAHESMDIVFECEISGSPAPTVKWVKNGDAVIPSDYFKIVKEHNLQVLGLVKSDEGFYQCLAENDAGNIQSSAQLIILDHGMPLDQRHPVVCKPDVFSVTR
ncbi:hypothetical protein F2P81_004241 [Scophthalmus maximus]|uniref:Ig-like domain-containing protein n=1 Tax=Scophthalmus maximus TaxID=52904 RepID=A0A6A4TI31_SCOMX|nr:hypothetical protein F2P81_004241 [Scophthalmus maximus]